MGAGGSPRSRRRYESVTAGGGSGLGRVVAAKPKRSCGRRASDHAARFRLVFGFIRELLWIAIIVIALIAGEWDRVFQAMGLQL